MCAAVPVRALLQLPLLGVNRGYKGLYGGGWPLRGMGAAGTALGAADARTNEHYEIGTILTQKSQGDPFVRLPKPLLNDDYAARRSICAFSAVEGMWAVRAYRVVLRRFDECDSQRRLFDPTEPLLLRGGVSADHPAELQSRGAPQIPLKRPRCCGGDIC